MTTLIARRRLPGKAKALAAIGAACIALIATGTASADDKNRDPWDRPMCSLKVYNGTLWYREGETVTINHSDGSKEALRCSNGNWVKVPALTPDSPDLLIEIPQGLAVLLRS